jgi:hypothetical protein
MLFDSDVDHNRNQVDPHLESEGEGMGGTLGINTPAGKKTGTAAIVTEKLSILISQSTQTTLIIVFRI